MLQSFKTLLGVVLKDRRRYRRALAALDRSYLELCNRSEHLDAAPDGEGFRCAWSWTSDLHAPKHLPSLGTALMKRALADHPVERRSDPRHRGNTPDVTFLIGHRGLARLPHLLATLESIAGQRDVAIECIVIEQDAEQLVRARLPEWVRYVHTPLPPSGMPYNRAWTFNEGARHARGSILVLHDNDMLVPADYGREIVRRCGQGFDVVNLKRFIFYLGTEHTRELLADSRALHRNPPETIVQNLEAGGSVAIAAAAYARIGGMDERFVGWGGEDNEFWERAQTLRVWPYAYLPIVHLWHAPQPEKLQARPATSEYYAQRAALPPEVRIAELAARGTVNREVPVYRPMKAGG